jgi:hypothetical protein
MLDGEPLSVRNSRPVAPRPALSRADVLALPAEAYSHRMAVLIAVAVLASERAMGACTYPEVVLLAWTLFPGKFSLPGRPEHPDSNAVYAKMVGADGLVARGLLRHAPELPRAWLPTPALIATARQHLARHLKPAAPEAPAAVERTEAPKALPKMPPKPVAPRVPAPPPLAMVPPSPPPAPRPPAVALTTLYPALKQYERSAAAWPYSARRAP